MDKNKLIGFLLIFAIMMLWIQVTAPTEGEIAEQERVRDSIEMAEGRKVDNAAQPAATNTIQNNMPLDSAALAQRAGQFGVFAPSISGTEQLQTIENEVMKITFTNKGGRIKKVELKKHDKLIYNENELVSKEPVVLLEDDNNKFEYKLPVGGRDSINTADLFFTPQLSGNTITYQAKTSNGGYFQQKYTLGTDYILDYNINAVGLNQVLNGENMQLNWVNNLSKIERGDWFERTYSGVYYKEAEDDPTYCTCARDDAESLEDPVKWVSTSNQFFNTSIIAEKQFSSADLYNKMFDTDAEDMKRITAQMNLPVADVASGINMTMFIGPNEFDKLKELSPGLEQIIPYGWSVFGTINRWVIRPFFQLLMNLVGSRGLAILLLTLIVKMLLYPLTYKMFYSQQKMTALKPKIEALKAKHGDDAQAMQMEQMKLYREYGASPLGGCMPMIVQMPIWIALFRFFPSSIDFRQATFLWAGDLSSYDDFFHLPFDLPFNMGSHLSLFAILWAISTVAYAYYNSKHMDMSANPAMKYMQYVMPLAFFGYFNAYAAGLTCYLFFSNFLNVTQNIITKSFIIDKGKIEAELENYKKDPKNKKKSGFQERLQAALAEQQKKQEAQMKDKKKKK